MQTDPLAMLNVDSHGNVSSFSPELLGLKNEAYGDYLLGNINTQSLAGIYQACLDSALHRDIQAGVAACSAACEYFSVCGGGAPVNKLFENGSFASTKTSYCTLTQIVPTDLILEAYDRLEQSWVDGGTLPSPSSSPLSHHRRPRPRFTTEACHDQIDAVRHRFRRRGSRRNPRLGGVASAQTPPAAGPAAGRSRRARRPQPGAPG